MREPVPILSIIRPRTERLFRKKLVKSGTCLEFTGTRNKRGYGFIDVTYENKSRRYPILAHRLAWALANGRDPAPGLIICHSCNNPSCCNPKHLYEGTPQDNVTDMIEAGTGKFYGMKGVKGAGHPRATYSQAKREQVIELKRTTKADLTDIARETGVNYQTVCRWWREYERGPR